MIHGSGACYGSANGPATPKKNFACINVYDPASRLMMIARCCLALLLVGSAPPVAAATLPEKLELEYDLTRNGIGIGEVSRTLQRRTNGSYVHTMWTRPTGLARLLTQTEWREEGEFIVQGTDVLPRRFSETRTGDKRAYEHRVAFNREKSLLLFSNAASQPLPRDVQDQSSAIYALMLNPIAQTGEHILPLTDGKDIETYRFIYQGKESLPTLFGAHEAVVIRRVSQKQFEHEQRCRTQTKPDADCKEPDDFTLWLLPEKCYVPVKLERRRKDETTTMALRAARGL
jgi:hypothetical protein